MTEAEPSAKVLFRVPNDDGTADVETLWAFDLGGDQYRLDNSPFYAYSVSWRDIVYAPFDQAEGHPTFSKVLRKSGHKTVRLILDPPAEPGNESQDILEALVKLGCSYEGSNPSYIAVDIPPPVDLGRVKGFLVDSGVQWEHADPSYEELYGDDA